MKLCIVFEAWAALAVALVWAASPAAGESKPTRLNGTVRFAVSGATMYTYNLFMEHIRGQLKGETLGNISVLRAPSAVPQSQRFLLVQLSNHAEESITLALDVTNVYIVGYLSSSNHFCYFNDFEPKNYPQLFPGTVKNPLGFTGSYTDLQRVAKQNREQILLGMTPLDQAITTLHLTTNAKDMTPVAKSLIVCIQMVTETTRFGYIEDMVEESMESGPPFLPSPQVISYEQNWDALSRAVQAGDGKNLKPPIQLLNVEGQGYTVKLVCELSSRLTLMLFAKPNLTATIQS